MNKTTQALLDKLCELQHKLTLAKQDATQQGEFATMWRDKCQELQREQNLSPDGPTKVLNSNGANDES